MINSYINGLITNEEVIAEMLKLAKQIAEAHKEGKIMAFPLKKRLLRCAEQAAGR